MGGYWVLLGWVLRILGFLGLFDNGITVCDYGNGYWVRLGWGFLGSLWQVNIWVMSVVSMVMELLLVIRKARIQ